MKLGEIKQLKLEEISDELNKSRSELVDLRMKFASRQLENPSQIRKKRKEIAWLLTIKTQKLNEGKGAPQVEPDKILLNKEKDLKKSKIKKAVKTGGAKKAK